MQLQESIEATIDELAGKLETGCDLSKTISKAHRLSRGLCPPGTWEKAAKAFRIPPIENYFKDVRIEEFSYYCGDPQHPTAAGVPSLHNLDPIARQFLRDVGKLDDGKLDTFFPYKSSYNRSTRQSVAHPLAHTVKPWDGDHIRLPNTIATGHGLDRRGFDGTQSMEYCKIGNEVLHEKYDFPDMPQNTHYNNRFGHSGYNAHHQRHFPDGTPGFAYWSFSDQLDELRVSWFKWWARPWILRPSLTPLAEGETRWELMAASLKAHNYDARIVIMANQWSEHGLNDPDSVPPATRGWGRELTTDERWSHWLQESACRIDQDSDKRIDQIQQRILDATKELRAEFDAEIRSREQGHQSIEETLILLDSVKPSYLNDPTCYDRRRNHSYGYNRTRVVCYKFLETGQTNYRCGYVSD
jgi:hypothetical protein